MELVRIGIIGTSGWADMFFLPVLSSYARADLVAICGRNQERAGEMAAKYSIPQVYSDYRQMIDDAHLDALVVASPDDLHYEMVMCALDAGLHVLCEKPLANNADQARQMLDKAETAGAKHMVNYPWRWLPQIQYIKHLLDKGYVGRAYQGSFRFSFSSRHHRDYSWSTDADRSNGVVGNLGSHMIDMARWLLGDVASVSASLTTQVERDGVNGRPLKPANDSAFVLLDFSSGAHCSIANSYVAHLTDEGGVAVALYGENGTLRSEYFIGTLDHVVYGARRDEDTIRPLDMPSTYLQGVVKGDMFAAFRSEAIGPRLFIDSILDNKVVEPNFCDGYENQRVIDAALESQCSGRRITIVDNHDKVKLQPSLR